MLHRRLAKLPRREVAGWRVPVALGAGSRLLGLARLGREEAGAGLLIPHCAAVHTFGMRFELDLCFLDESGRPLSTRLRVPPRRFVREPGAAMVLELPSPPVPDRKGVK